MEFPANELVLFLSRQHSIRYMYSHSQLLSHYLTIIIVDPLSRWGPLVLASPSPPASNDVCLYTVVGGSGVSILYVHIFICC